MSGTSGAYPIGTEHTPNWLPGYVPPAAEWNMWWSNKVDFDDTRLTGGPFLSLAGGTMTGELILAGPPVNVNDAATKAYVDQFTPIAGPFLPMSGGTMTGMLTLAGNPVGNLDATPRQYVDGVGNTANQALSVANAAVARTGSTMTGPLMLSGNPTAPLGAATKQYVDGFLPLWGGNLYGPVGSSSSIEAQNIYSNSTMFMNAFNGWEWNFQVDVNGSKYQFFRNGWYDVWDGTNGTRSWVGPGATLMWLDGGSNLNVGGTVNAGAFNTGGTGSFGTVNASTVNAGGNVNGGNLSTGGTVTGAWIHSTGDVSADHQLNASGDLHVSGTGYINGNVYGAQVVANGDLVTNSYGVIYTAYSSGHAFAFANVGGGYIYCYDNGGAAGSLVPPSTELVKQSIQPSRYDCLSTVLRTPLFEFIRTGSETRTPVGFVAERQHEVFPESVLMLDDKPFGIDLMTVVAALYGAVQQLANMIAPASKA